MSLPVCGVLFTQATPVHAKDLFNKLRLGLGCNTMEGREQKHQHIDKHFENSLYQKPWKFVFHHEYIQLMYVPENNFDNVKYLKRISQYIPNVGTGYYINCFLKCNYLFCLLRDSEVYKEIVAKMKD